MSLSAESTHCWGVFWKGLHEAERGFGEGWGCSALHQHPKAVTASDAAPCSIVAYQPVVHIFCVFRSSVLN